jgi:hypothetical protein
MANDGQAPARADRLVGPLQIPAKLLQRDFPVLYGRPSLTRDGWQTIQLAVDLFGECFFYLSGLKEV